jgi:Lrp/AsnC family leucine-responsive transcriptional regulator
MSILLTDNDIAILAALLKDGRKSFRQISREIGVSTPTIKSRFSRLLNMGIIKSVSPILDVEKLSCEKNVEGKKGKQIVSIVSNSLHKNIDNNRFKTSGIRIDRGLSAKIDCDYCKTPLARMFALKIANFERFFCCRECRSAYKKKYVGRIEAIKKRHRYQDANLNMH